MKRLSSLKSNLLGMTAILCGGYLIGVASAPVYAQIPHVEIPPNVALMAIAIFVCLYIAIRNAR